VVVVVVLAAVALGRRDRHMQHPCEEQYACGRKPPAQNKHVLSRAVCLPCCQVPGDAAADHAARTKAMDAQIDTLRKLVPHLDDIHEIRADESEECILAMGVDVPLLPSTFNLIMADKENGPLSWDMAPVYRNYKQVLQLLSHQRLSQSAGKAGGVGGTVPRWILKSPAHLGFVKYLKEAFPDAKVVWTHRDPCESIPSLCSMFRTFQETFYAGDVNLRELGQRCASFWEAMLARAHADLGDGGGGGGGGAASTHVRYKDLIKDPKGTVKGLYKSFGWAYSDEYDVALSAYLEENDRKRKAAADKAKAGGKANATGHVAHTYSLGEYGLDEDAMRYRLAWYTDAYIGKDEKKVKKEKKPH